jgi:hypothetical protein
VSELTLFDPEPYSIARRHHCLGCRRDTIDLGEYYMLRDEIWLQVAGPLEGMLCIGCFEERLGRALVMADFSDVPINFVRARRSQRLMSRLGFA